MKIKVAILDQDSRYLLKLGNALNNKYNDKLQLYSFTEEEVALENLRINKIDIFIASKQFDIKADLLPKGCAFTYLVEDKEDGVGNRDCAIKKYRKIDLIYKDILTIYAEKMSTYTSSAGGDIGKIPCRAFVSMSGGTGSSTVAASYALSQAKIGKRPLYINLEIVGGSNQFFHGEGSGTFSNIIYALKSKKSNLSLIIESNVKVDPRGVYFLESCSVACDLMEMNEEDLNILLQEINRNELYDCIVLDLDFQIGDVMFEAFNCANSIVVVNDGSMIANGKFIKAMQALEIFEQQRDIRFLPKVSVLYNKFRNRTSTMIEGNELRVLGGIQQFEGARTEQLMEQIASLPYVIQIS